MKAIIAPKYGKPDVLKLAEVDKPSPGDNEVLVNIKAVAINPLDWHKLSGMLPVRMGGVGLFKPKLKIFGADIAGVVETVGRNVKQLKEGDEVFGDISQGGFADYACTTEDKLVKKPLNSTMIEAAAIPVAAFTALHTLRNYGRIQQGQKVLVNGASGGVGHFAVQIAKSHGTEVTGVCSTGNIEMVRSIGADHVIDYTKEDFTTTGIQYDLIADCVGNKSVSELKKSLTSDGTAAVAGFTSIPKLIKMAIFQDKLPKEGEAKPGKKIHMVDVKINQPDLIQLGEMSNDGVIKPFIEGEYSFEQIPEALTYLGTRRIRGKVVISIS